MLYCLSNSDISRVLTISKQLILLITFFFTQKDPKQPQRWTANRLDFVPRLFSFWFTLHLIPTPLFLFYGYIAPKQKSKSPWKTEIKETLVSLSTHAQSRDSRSARHLPQVPTTLTRTEAIRLTVSVDFQAFPSTQLYKSRDKLFQQQLN